MGVQQQQGVLLQQKFTRSSFRINTEFDVLPGVRVGENIQGTYRSTRILLGSNGGSGSSDDENIILTTSRMASAIPVFDEFGGYAGTAAPGFNNPQNPVAELDGRANDRSFSTSAFGNVYVEYEPIDNLVLRTSFGGRHTSSNSRSFSRQTYENSENNGSFGFSRNTGFNTDWIWTTTINYKRSLGSHNFDLLAGQEALSNGEGRFISASGINPFSQDPNFVNLTTVSNQVVNEFIGTAVRFSSYFGRFNYDFKGKYIASVVIRHDGSSRFGAGNRTGIFPAFSLAWRVSDEKFMKNIGFIDDFKIRGGWGRMGNSNNVNPSNQFSLFGTTIGGSSYDINGTNSSAVQGFFRTRIGNPAAKWETAVTKNVGFDALLFNGKLDIGFEYWRKNTSNLLLQVPVTVMTGPFASAPSVNVGSMLNKGVDFQITNKGKIKELGYEITLTGGFLDNKITSFAPGIDNIPNFSRNFRGVTPILNQVGQPISSFFGFQVQGLFKDQAEVDGAATQDGAAPGRFRFADINGFDSEGNLTGQPDGVIDLADRKALGSPVPDFTGGIALRLNYKHFEVEGYGFLSVGGEIYNMSRLFTDFYPLFPGAAISERVKNSWTFANPTGDIPIFENVSNFSTNTQSSSFFVEDGSYFRMQNITLSYHVPGSILDHLGIGSLRVYASVNNVFTVSNYSGLDPSIGGAADTSFGIDLGNFPITRSWTFGVNMGF